MQNQTEKAKKDLRQRCIDFSVNTLLYVDTFSRAVTSDVIAKQLARSATSVGANVTEAFGSGSKRDFVNFFSIALKSAKETAYWLLLCQRAQKGNLTLLPALAQECEELTRMIAASILTVKGKR